MPLSSCEQLMHPPDSVSAWQAAYSVPQAAIMQGSQPISLFGSPLVHVIMHDPGLDPEELPLPLPLLEQPGPPGAQELPQLLAQLSKLTRAISHVEVIVETQPCSRQALRLPFGQMQLV
jgi:hypothetical protein